ncbi:hypothetical protein CesoFtcFv8_002476 [Champsocephalus esox]|uniref:Uncharacterized protein n=1 Tax=Champsocephalus esox TaxID=159716 RepID=A0AAN8HER6_9TELE|nr:hypothetical protein CesoFtcFv8_002476 [Champsocephalus esox]
MERRGSLHLYKRMERHGPVPRKEGAKSSTHTNIHSLLYERQLTERHNSEMEEKKKKKKKSCLLSDGQR